MLPQESPNHRSALTSGWMNAVTRSTISGALPCSAMRFTMALPTTTASAQRAISFTCSGFDTPKPTAIGREVDSWWVSDVIFTPARNSDARWNFWQFTWRGRIPGINGFVDLDVFNGSLRDFEILAGDIPKNQK